MLRILSRGEDTVYDWVFDDSMLSTEPIPKLTPLRTGTPSLLIVRASFCRERLFTLTCLIKSRNCARVVWCRRE